MSAKIHFGACPLCEQGHICPARCPDCSGWIALCDECEAIWADPRAYATTKAASQHPRCPHCGNDVEKWNFPNEKQLQRYGLENLIVSRGKSSPSTDS